MTKYLEETIAISDQEHPLHCLTLNASVSEDWSTKITKDQIRSSLHASTLDGVFSTIFSNMTGGVLLSNFLVELDATPLQIGMLASMPMLANLLQPLGAYWADCATSRRRYSLWVYGVSRLLWLPLAIAIIALAHHPLHPQQIIIATLAVLLATHGCGAIGSASWLSWLAALVPRQLRGRYFGFRNSTSSLTSLIALPILGSVISHWRGGSLQGFGVMLIVAVLAGLISLGFQSRMTDVNPQTYHFKTSALVPFKPKTVEFVECEFSTSDSQPFQYETIVAVESDAQLESIVGLSCSLLQHNLSESDAINSTAAISETAHSSILNNSPFLLFLLYLGAWSFGINVSNPFFSLYLLDNLSLDLSWVTLYNSLGAGANLIMLLVWGKLADRIGNRSILLLDGILVAIIPLLWLSTDANTVSIWLWFPLLHLLGGGAGAAIDLCINNLQLGIAPVQHHTKYFAITAAIGGVFGAIGALAGGWLAQFTEVGGMTGLFALSSVLRLVALLPLLGLQESAHPSPIPNP